MSLQHRLRAALCASLFLSPMLLTGCSDDGTVNIGSQVKFVTGNWQVSSSSAAAAKISAISGVLSGTSDKITGILHTQSAGACVAPTTIFEVKGAADEKGNVTLSGPVANGTLTVSGTLAADGKSLTNASYGISGGTCATAQTVLATAQVYTPISGNYAGTFTDPDGQVAQITATLNQSATADGSGNYILTGSATLPNNPCFPTTVPVSATQVTGGTFTFTYASTTDTVTATGTFSNDAAALNVTNWVSSGSCGADHGTGTMTRP